MEGKGGPWGYNGGDNSGANAYNSFDSNNLVLIFNHIANIANDIDGEAVNANSIDVRLCLRNNNIFCFDWLILYIVHFYIM